MLGVADAEKSAAFYRDRLGLKVTGQHESFVFLDAGGLTLALSPGLAAAVGNIPVGCEFSRSRRAYSFDFRTGIAGGAKYSGIARLVFGWLGR
jgi:catechol 2,3-dioxygenase-like lactoylglutathione lyase family enzyme